MDVRDVYGSDNCLMITEYLFPDSSMVEHLPVKQRVTGSSPVRGANPNTCHI